MLQNLVKDLTTKGEIKTTLARAKKLKRLVNTPVRILHLGRRRGDAAPLARVIVIKKEKLKDDKKDVSTKNK